MEKSIAEVYINGKYVGFTEGSRLMAELEKSDGTHIRVDYKVSGIGSNSCGPALDEKYRLCEKDISF